MIKVQGKVVSGKREGTKLGFPTANIKITNDVLPGIYAGYAKLAKDSSDDLEVLFYISADNKSIIECHILDFPEKDLYGSDISVRIVHKLRNVRKFSGLEDAVQQINKDVQEGKEWFKKQAKK